MFQSNSVIIFYNFANHLQTPLLSYTIRYLFLTGINSIFLVLTTTGAEFYSTAYMRERYYYPSCVKCKGSVVSGLLLEVWSLSVPIVTCSGLWGSVSWDCSSYNKRLLLRNFLLLQCLSLPSTPCSLQPFLINPTF